MKINKLDEIREQIQERINYVKQLDHVHENNDEYDSRRDRYDAANQINKLKDKETKLENELEGKGISYYEFVKKLK